MKILKKPLKDWNLGDMLVASLAMIALIPFGFWTFCKGFDVLEKFDNKKDNDTEEDEG